MLAFGEDRAARSGPSE